MFKFSSYKTLIVLFSGMNLHLPTFSMPPFDFSRPLPVLPSSGINPDQALNNLASQLQSRLIVTDGQANNQRARNNGESSSSSAAASSSSSSAQGQNGNGQSSKRSRLRSGDAPNLLPVHNPAAPQALPAPQAMPADFPVFSLVSARQASPVAVAGPSSESGEASSESQKRSRLEAFEFDDDDAVFVDFAELTPPPEEIIIIDTEGMQYSEEKLLNILRSHLRPVAQATRRGKSKEKQEQKSYFATETRTILNLTGSKVTKRVRDFISDHFINHELSFDGKIED